MTTIIRRTVFLLLPLFLIFTTYSCRNNHDDLSGADRIKGIWILTSNNAGGQITYSFDNNGTVTITMVGSTNPPVVTNYSVNFENFSDPSSDKDQQEVIHLGNTKYLLNFTDADHMSFSLPNNGTQLIFERQH